MEKVVCLIESLGSGGAERQLTYLASQLKASGYEVEVWTYYPNDFYAHVLFDAGVPWRYISSAKSKLLRLPIIIRKLQNANPDVVIAYLDICTSMTCFIKGLGGKFKLIVSERNTTQKLTLREKIKFFLYRWADFIVPNSYSQSEFIQNHYPKLKSKIHTITNFVDTEKFVPPIYKEQSDVPRILTVARVVPQKNVIRLLETVKLLKDKGYRFRYAWYGNHVDHDYSELCKDLIKKNELEDVFTFYDHSKDILREYHHSDIFCLPSLYEGFPNVICEAMSCGLPIVASAISEHNVIIPTRMHEFMFDPLSIADMVKGIETILKCTKDEIKKIGETGHEYAMTLFDSKRFIDSYKSLIND